MKITLEGDEDKIREECRKIIKATKRPSARGISERSKRLWARREAQERLVARRKQIHQAYMKALRSGDAKSKNDFAGALSGRIPITDEIVETAAAYISEH